MAYNHKEIEPKWQKYWEERGLFRVSEKAPAKDKFYILDMFAYPSGDGLHVGHPRGYTASDILAKYYKMKGKNVLHPFGWDAFGLPAENYAIKVGVHPAETTDKNVARFKEQLTSFGFGYDWSREINTSKPDYYKWTQWVFKVLYENGYAYQKEAYANWCPKCQTVLANEQVVGGQCERCQTEVEQKKMKQWFFKITDFAEELINGLDKLDWPDSTKEMQKNWIGRSEGAELEFKIKGSADTIKVFTTRADTLFGVTYMVLAPEHELVDKVTTDDQRKEVEKYVADARLKSALDRTSSKEKTGVFTGAYAINPANGEEIPIWVADYVLADYGFGAVMAVPAHDVRDNEFAIRYGLPMVRVVHRVGASIKSYLMGADDISDEDLKDLDIEIVRTEDDGDRCLMIPLKSVDKYEKLITDKLTPGFWNEYVGDEAVFLFKFKDGSIKRLVLSDETVDEIDRLADEFVGGWTKRYPWGWLAQNSWYTDVIVHSDHGVLENSGDFDGTNSEEAAVKIAKKVGGKMTVQYKLHDWLVSRQRYWGAPIPIVYKEDGEAVAVDDKDLPVVLPTDVDFKPSGESPLADSKEFQAGVEDKYGKGAHRELDTLDTFVCSSWYFLRYCDPHNEKEFAGKAALKYWMPVDFYVGGAEHTNGHLLYSRFITKVLHRLGYLSFDEPFLRLRHQGMIQGEDGEKMSKSRGNVVNPDDVVEQYGADTMRMYEMFVGPFSLAMPWDTKGIVGVRRFLDKAWKAIEISKSTKEKVADGDVDRLVKKVTDDLESEKFNTAISTMMEFINRVQGSGWAETFAKLIAPLAPHFAEEIWQNVLGNKDSILEQTWPEFDASKIVETNVNVVVAENGKKRAVLELPAGVSEDEVMAEMEKDERLAQIAKTSKKRIYIQDKMINFIG